jgi:hypothetical protein
MTDDDDRPDTTFLSNWRFWLIFFVMIAIYGVVIWAGTQA